MPKTETYTDQLVALEQARDDAKWRVSALMEEYRTSRSDLARQVMADLSKFHAANEHSSPSFLVEGAAPPEQRAERERELTKQTAEAIVSAGLTLVPLSTPGGDVVLGIRDNHVDPELEAAREEADALSRDLANFVSVHAADLEAERGKAEADRIREAMKGDDPDAIREALNPSRGPANVFTTDDLARPVVHKRSPVIGR
jgi:hypothetical protein